MSNDLHVRGAREHNLRNIDVIIPRDKLTVITGLSGSGKSSLAFDTIYAEGQRRYVESLSAYARQFLQLMEKPDVDAIDGLSPAISIEQKTTSKNPRSTVGTITEIYDYLRLLYARIGIPYSPATGLPIESQTVSEMVDRILRLPEETRVLILAPIVRGRKGEYKKELVDLVKRGFQRVKVDGTVYSLDEVPTLNKKIKHNIEVIVDRLVIKPGIERRLSEAIETCLQLSEGLVLVEQLESDQVLTLSSRFACPVSGFTLDEIEPRLFSFNSPFGACPECDGLGVTIHFDPELVVPNPEITLREGAIAPWNTSFSFYYLQMLEAVTDAYGGDLDTPFLELPEPTRQIILFGSGKERIPMLIQDGSRRHKTNKPFEGVIPSLERRQREKKERQGPLEEINKYQSTHTCELCSGWRIKEEARAVKIKGLHLGEVTELSIEKAAEWFSCLSNSLSEKEQQIASRILREINERLGFLVSVGLNYLTLSRSSSTLSGGESQRIRLASQIGSGLTGVLYVLDEPSIGLHQRDNDQLLTTLKRLRDLGNTVIVVEHDEDAILTADHVIDMGPGAGLHGGSVVAEGTPEQIQASEMSLTGQYLRGAKYIPLPANRRPIQPEKSIVLEGASINNLKDVTARIPLSTFTCVTGVSGGGKSSLIIETLYKALAHTLNGASLLPGPHKAVHGLDNIDKIIDIDQSPIGRTPRSNPATYTGVFTPIREWFAGLPEAKARGYTAGRFSFNVKGGRCEACQGDGVTRIEMHFLPDVYVECDQCHGQRYNRETLEVKYRDQSIANVLDMTVDEALEFFDAVPSIKNKLSTLQNVGLGYIHVGQRATTLSGGEAQRVKLAKELSKRSTGKTLYILDEPTTGLHFEDIRKLLEVLHSLVDQGNTVVVIEHNLEVIKTADWIMDIGPEGGERGGQIVAEGIPEVVAMNKESYTAKYLKPLLERSEKLNVPHGTM